MPTFEFTSPDNKVYSIDGPAGATKEQAFQILQMHLQGGKVNPQIDGVPGADPSALAGNRNVGQRLPDSDPSLVDRIVGGAEGALSVATGATTGMAGLIGGALAGLGKSVADGDFGTQKGVQTAEKYAAEGMNKFTYAPRGAEGQRQVEALGHVMNEALPVMAQTAELNAIGKGAQMAAQGVRDLAPVAKDAAIAAGRKVVARADAANAPMNAADAALRAEPKAPLRDLVRKPQPALSGVGAAKTPQEAIRAERFERLGIKPTLGQLTREKEQLKFEQDIAKQPEGQVVDSHLAEQNAQVQRKFNELSDKTGATVTQPVDVGNAVIDALEAKQAAKKAEIRSAYDEANAAGEMQEPVDVTNLVNFVKVNKGKDKIAPIISMIESEINQNAQQVGGNLDKLTLTPTPKRHVMTLAAAEDLRQAINDSIEPGTPNSVWGTKAKRVLDSATEGKGGELYKAARKQYADYMREFGDHDVVAKLLRTKPGTKDRAVVAEQVFQHTILNPKGADDIVHVFKVLEDHPPGTDAAIVEAGQQAARELRGALVEHIRDKMFSNGGANTAGDVVGSQAKIKNVIADLDRKGKLKAVLGPEAASVLRDIGDAAVDIYTLPSGVGQASNNEVGIIKAIEKLEKKTKRIPLAEQVTGYVGDRARERVIAKRIEKALNPDKAAKRPANNF